MLQCILNSLIVIVDRHVTMEILSSCWILLSTATIATSTTALVYPSAVSLIKPIKDDPNSDWHEVFFDQVKSK